MLRYLPAPQSLCEDCDAQIDDKAQPGVFDTLEVDAA
jgi:hypothetical protein